MSLINEMLRDLERRRAPERYPSGVVLGGAGWDDDGPHARHQRWGLLLSGTVAVAVAVLIIKGFPHPAPAPDGVGLILPVTPVPQGPAPQRPLTPPASDGAVAFGAIAPLPVPLSQGQAQDGISEAAKAAPAAVPVTAGDTAMPPPAPHHGTVDSAGTPHLTPRPAAAALKPAPSVPLKIGAHPLSTGQRVANLRDAALRLIRNDDLTGAERKLNEALALEPGRIPVREALVGVLVKQGRLEEAGAALRQGLVLKPGATPLVELQARIYMMQGDDARARALLERYAPRIADDPDYHAMLAAIYERQGDFAKAQAEYQSLVALHPGNGVWWMGLGLAMEANGRVDDARAAYRRAQHSPDLSDKLRQFIEERLASLS